MKIELDLPQVTEGWRCIGFKMPKKGQGYCGPNGEFSISEIDNSFYKYITFERIEPVDHELEEAKKKFPVGSWFYINMETEVLYTVHSVRRSTTATGGDIWVDFIYDAVMNAERANICTPFPIPTWRCCESDKPEKSCSVITRHKLEHSFKKLGMDYVADKGWESIHLDREKDYEWLDEGGAE